MRAPDTSGVAEMSPAVVIFHFTASWPTLSVVMAVLGDECVLQMSPP